MKALRINIVLSCLAFFLLISSYNAYSGGGCDQTWPDPNYAPGPDYCHDSVPTFIVDFTGNPDSLWCSPVTIRHCTCCGLSGNYTCLQFWVTMDPNAQLVTFQCEFPPCPPGMEVYIECTLPLYTWSTSESDAACLSANGTGPYQISACKPGGGEAAGFCIKSWAKQKIFDGDWIASFTPIFEECKNISDPDSMQVPFVSPDTLTNFILSFGDPYACTNDTVAVDSSSLWTNGSVYVCAANVAGPIWYPGDTIWHTYDSLGYYAFSLTQIVAGCDITINGAVINKKSQTALFLASSTSGCHPLTVNFSNFSCGVISYLWNFGDGDTSTSENPSHTFTNTALSTDSIYTVMLIVTDSLGFNDTMTQDITVHPKLAALFTVDTITVISPFQFIVTITNSSINADNVFWDFGDGSTSTDTSETFTHTYTFNTLCDSTIYSLQLIVENNYGCTDTDSVKVTAPYYFSTYITNTNVSCNGGSDGTADLTVIGFSSYSYSWSNGDTTEDISGLAAGIYTVDVTDSNGCSLSDSITITEPNLLNVNITAITEPTCKELCDGSIFLNVSGGTVPYTYYCGFVPCDFNNMCAGYHYVLVTDSQGCSISDDSIIISGPDSIIITSIVDTSNQGNNDGAINLTVTGGTPPYVFLWSNGDTTEDIDSLAAGTYQVVVTDSLDCIDSLTIEMPEATGISETLQNQIKIFPNPFTTETTISLNLSSNKKNVLLTLYDILARKQDVLYKIKKKRNNKVEIKVQKGNLTKGIYFYKISSAKKELLYMGKLIVN